MAKKIIFNDNIVQYPNRYSITDLGSGLYELALSPGTVTQDGTPLSAANLNAVADEVIFKLKDTSTSTTAYTASIDGLSAYYEGLTILFKPANTNTAAATLNINSISAINLKKVDDTGAKVALVANDLIKNKYYTLIYDGTDLVVSNPSSDLAAIISDISNVENRLTTDESSISSLKNEVIRFTVSTGSANTYLANLSDVTAYYSGLILNMVINVDNTGASTLNVTGLGAKAIKFAGNDLTAGMLKANTICQLIYDGTVFNLQPTAKQVNDLQNDLVAQKADYVRQPGYGVDSGTANAYAITLTPAPTSYIDGMGVIAKIAHANTGASTLNVNGLGAKTIVNPDGTALSSGDLSAGGIYSLKYNSTTSNFILVGKGGVKLTGTAQPSDVLSGKTFYNTDVKTLLTGMLSYKKSATGLTASDSSNMLTVTGLGFTPQMVLVYDEGNGGFVWMFDRAIGGWDGGSSYVRTKSYDYYGNTLPTTNNSFTADGFKVQCQYQAVQQWIALE